MEEAARVAGISAKTLLRWLKLPDFKAAYLEARREAVSQAHARLQQGTSAAVSTLLKIMIDVGGPAAARVRAADRVLEHAKYALELEDLEMRVASLEAARDGRRTDRRRAPKDQ